jgi:hypothetical protein
MYKVSASERSSPTAPQIPLGTLIRGRSEVRAPKDGSARPCESAFSFWRFLNLVGGSVSPDKDAAEICSLGLIVLSGMKDKHVYNLLVYHDLCNGISPSTVLGTI